MPKLGIKSQQKRKLPTTRNLVFLMQCGGVSMHKKINNKLVKLVIKTARSNQMLII